jgi:hypothetical protein
MENVGVLWHERQPAEQEAHKRQSLSLAWRFPSISAEQLYQTVSIVLFFWKFLSLVTKGRPSARAVAPMMQSQGSLVRVPPLSRANQWTLDIPKDSELSGRESEQIAFFGSRGNDLDDGGSALGDDDRLSGGLHIVHDGQAAGFEGAGAPSLHGSLFVSMVMLA